MKYFLKALLLSLRYKWTLVLASVNAVLIALVWGASVSSVYPFVEVVFEGNTLQSWLEQEIAEADSEVARLRAEIGELQQERPQDGTDAATTRAAQLTLREGHLVAYQKKRDFWSSLQPWAERWGPRTPYGTLAALISLLLLATAFKGACLVLNVVLVARIASATVSDLRRIFFREMLRMDQQRIDRIGTTKLMTMLSHNVNLIQAGLRAIYGKAIREPLKIVACLAVAAAISWRLLLLSLAIAPLGYLVIHLLAQRMKKSAFREMAGFAAIFQTLLNTLHGIKIVRVFTRERTARRQFKEKATALYRMAMRIAFYDSLIRPVSEIIAIVALSVAIMCGAYLVLQQETHLLGIRLSAAPLSASQMFTFFAMLAGIADPARKLSDIYNVIVRAVMASNYLYSTLEEKPQITNPAVPKRAPLHARSLRFENVTFGYEAQSPVLRGFDLEIPFGQTIALVGVNGSGKSTVTNLIARFYDPQAGNVYLDDVNLREIRPRQLRKQIGIVTQDPILFRGMIWDNIKFGDFNATDEQIRHAAELAHVTDFLQEVPRGFLTFVGDRGKQLSGGQRQRVALARAILADPRILILDEATSQLDAQTEIAVHESLQGFLRRRTTILITHRWSTLMLADRVVALRAGRIIQDMPASQVNHSADRLLEMLGKAA